MNGSTRSLSGASPVFGAGYAESMPRATCSSGRSPVCSAAGGLGDLMSDAVPPVTAVKRHGDNFRCRPYRAQRSPVRVGTMSARVMPKSCSWTC